MTPEAKCRVTGEPFEMQESQTDEHTVAVLCSECGEILTEYEV